MIANHPQKITLGGPRQKQHSAQFFGRVEASKLRVSGTAERYIPIQEPILQHRAYSHATHNSSHSDLKGLHSNLYHKKKLKHLR